jgi:transcriptional regulator with GAF, ATPase, and Fis domain
MDNVQRPPLDTGAVAAALQASILDSADINGFLADVVFNASKAMSAARHSVACGIILVTSEHVASVASSNARARHMDETQHKAGSGPGLSAARSHQPARVDDTRTETRWRNYLDAVRDSGVRSILSVPFEVEGDAVGALNLYSPTQGAFSPQLTSRALRYAHQASASLRLALLIAELTDSKQGIIDVIQSRTNITLALGITMALHRCTQQRAFELLQKAGSGEGGLAAAAADTISAIENRPETTDTA